MSRKKEGNSATTLNRRLSAQQSATSARQELGTFSILRDSRKYATCLDVHYSACSKTLQLREMRGTRTYCSSACPLSYAQPDRHLLHTITAMGIWASPSRLTYAAENSHKHHRTLDIHALSLAEQSLGESVTAISLLTPQRLGYCMNVSRPSFQWSVFQRSRYVSSQRSESGISPLTASAVTRAITSLHTGPPFIVVPLVRELMSARVHAARFLSPARPNIRERLTPFGRAPT